LKIGITGVVAPCSIESAELMDGFAGVLNLRNPLMLMQAQNWYSFERQPKKDF
tara:strand:- start:526 stop:684 length:159 start_codon:yes stop_codon:yes gene_type:complete